MFTSESCGTKLRVGLMNLISCNIGKLPYNVTLMYGNSTLTVWKNATSSIFGPKCMSVNSFTCEDSDYMKFDLYLNSTGEGCQSSAASMIVAEYDDAIQQKACISFPGWLILSIFSALCACACEEMQYCLFLTSIAAPCTKNTTDNVSLVIIVSLQCCGSYV